MSIDAGNEGVPPTAMAVSWAVSCLSNLATSRAASLIDSQSLALGTPSAKYSVQSSVRASWLPRTIVPFAWTPTYNARGESINLAIAAILFLRAKTATLLISEGVAQGDVTLVRF